MELLLDPNVWIAFAMLTALEIVLGIDNIIFISIISNSLPNRADQRKSRQIGLLLAMVTRVLLLLSLSWVMSLDEPFVEPLDHPVSGKDLVLLLGGLFLIYKATVEIRAKVVGIDEEERRAKRRVEFDTAVAVLNAFRA